MLHGIANERVRFAADRFWSQVFTVDRYRRKLVLNVPRHRIQTLTPSPTSSTSRMSRVFALFTYPTTLFNPAPIFPATVTSRSDPSICFAFCVHLRFDLLQFSSASFQFRASFRSSLHYAVATKSICALIIDRTRIFMHSWEI